MCKHQTKQQFLLKLEAAEQVNNTPDNQDMQRVTGLSLEDFGTIEGARAAYEMSMNVLFQRGDKFAIRCTLFSNLNLVNYESI